MNCLEVREKSHHSALLSNEKEPLVAQSDNALDCSI